jgi:hypothetical protein
LRALGCRLMLVKIVTFFLIGIAILAMFGRLKFPGQNRLKNAKCPKCGRYKMGRGPCSCGHIGRDKG